MKRLKTILAMVVVVGIMITILMMNRAKMAAEARNDEVRFLPVTLVAVGQDTLMQDLTLTGTIAANNDVAVAAETGGKVTKVHVNVGDHVAASQPLIQLDDELKQASFQMAEVAYLKAKRDLERFETLIKDSSVSDVQLENTRLAFKSAEAQYIVARRQLNDTRIKSPISGIVTARPVDVGSNVQVNNIVANVVDISQLKLKLNVAERDVFKMKVGDKVAVSTDVYPGVSFIGRISTISAKADDGHTYAVEAIIPNTIANPLRAGMFGRVSFSAVKPVAALSIPRAALVGSLRQPQVFVVENLTAHLRNFIAGGEYGSKLEVISGLSAGEQVVVTGQNNLKDNVAVSVVK